jgi:hypothetical protein
MILNSGFSGFLIFLTCTHETTPTKGTMLEWKLIVTFATCIKGRSVSILVQSDQVLSIIYKVGGPFSNFHLDIPRIDNGQFQICKLDKSI